MKGQDSFHAAHTSMCRGCNKRIHKGENVWAPGVKGQFYTGVSQGMFHIHCQPEVTVRQMTDEELAERRERMNQRRRTFR